jgi:ADP-ribose pyrophosphatase YjhB (NUDIX family)
VSILDVWRFCPRCRGELEREDGRVHCPSCKFEAWANSVPGAQALIGDERGRLLLGRRGNEPGRGRWDLPGGFLEEGEHPLDGLRREVLEETGLEIEPTSFFGIWMEPYDGRSVLCLTWLARAVGGVERAGDDLVELRWFVPEELPGPDELAFSSFPDILGRWRDEQP